MLLIFRNLRRLVPLLPPRAQRFIGWFIAATSLLAAVDVVAIALLAISLGSMVTGSDINLPVFGTIGPDSYVWFLLSISVVVIAKALISLILQWFATRRFASFELEVGDRLFDAYIRAPWTDRLSKNTAQLVRLADVGIGNTIGGFLLPVLTLPTLVVTSVAVIAVIVIVEPVTALVTIGYLGSLAALQAWLISKRAVQAGRVNRDYSFRVASLMTDMVSALKEITLRDKAAEVAGVVHDNRIHSTKARANIHFIGAVPRFVLDAGLIGGFLLVGGVAFLLSGPAGALASVALFGVAGFRLVPSLTSLQSILTTTQANSAHVQAVLDDIAQSRAYIERAEVIGHEPIMGEPRVLRFEGAAFTYPSSDTPAISGISLEIPLGASVGLVGSSGSGKTTMVDMLLGLLSPTEGRIMLDDANLDDVMAAWRTRVGYVPQDVALFDGTVAQNVALSWSGEIDLARVERALRRAQLWQVVEKREGGMGARVGDRGMALSGGQRQRLGIARALYDDPIVLVLDEATSALDTKTEADVVQAIRSLQGEMTVISVAHRLATIRDNDLVVFLADGRLIAQGSFDAVRRAVPEFATQASLAGLDEGELGESTDSAR